MLIIVKKKKGGDMCKFPDDKTVSVFTDMKNTDTKLMLESEVLTAQGFTVKDILKHQSGKKIISCTVDKP